MAKVPITEELDLRGIAVQQAFGPVTIGANLNEVGDALGAPDYWGFAPGEELHAFMNFCDIEVHFSTVRNIAVVTLAIVRVPELRSNIAYLVKGDWYSRRIMLRLPPRRDRKLGRLKEFFSTEGIQFDTKFRAPVTEGTKAVINIGKHLNMYFGHNDDLEVIQLSRLPKTVPAGSNYGPVGPRKV